MTAAAEVAIVNYGMGNLFSVARACEVVGLSPCITQDPQKVRQAAAVILPGVGAFGKAKSVLDELGLSEAIVACAASGKPVLGICLGFQLFMQKSCEFGETPGLALFCGEVLPLQKTLRNPQGCRIPHIGWARLLCATEGQQTFGDSRMLQGVASGQFMYFVHSFFVQPEGDTAAVAYVNPYGQAPFCVALEKENVWGVQFHPEKSASEGLRIIGNFRKFIYQI